MENGADVNFMTEKLNMTPLHWAAYQSDEQMVELLLAKGAVMVETKLGDTPVDMAGFCSEVDTVLVFCRDLRKRLDKQAEDRKNNPDAHLDPESQTRVSPA